MTQSEIKESKVAGLKMTDNKVAKELLTASEIILAVHSAPTPLGVHIVIIVSPSGIITEESLAAATPAILQTATRDTLALFKDNESASVMKVIEMQPITIEWISNYRASTFSYSYTDKRERSTWISTQYKVPIDDVLIQLTFSHRDAEDYMWKPILERIKRSVQF